jgi:acyl-homoserine-lactone acylase
MTRRRLLGALVAVLAVATSCTSSSKESSPTTVKGAGGYQATIRRTTDGVPHIVGADLGSVSFGQGWASAEDRLCELADQVVKIRGERAKWFGRGDKDKYLNSDITWRTIGIYDRAKADYAKQTGDVRSLLEGFAAGWNAELAKTGVDHVKGWCKGAAWVKPVKAVDVYAYARSLALMASGGALGGYIPPAQPPSGATPASSVATTSTSLNPVATSTTVGSNGWAIGANRSANGDGLLLANPHFPWQGELRFWEVQLTVPGKFDIYGVQLSGLPGVGIGFTKTFAWTHTVSAGNRFTAYTLGLVPGTPTSYKYGSTTKAMTSKKFDIAVQGKNGSTDTVTHTSWYSHYGPIVSLPGFEWSTTRAVTYRDANIDDTTFLDQYLAMDQSQNLDQFISAHEKYTGVPLFNTIAVSNDGRAWYADTSATPDLSAAAIKDWEQLRKTDALVAAAYQQGVVVLDGSDPKFEWVDEPGARSPGLVPYAKMPKVERKDYVFNANDSFWMPNATAFISGDYSPLHGLQETARSPRTRENAVVLSDTSASGPSGADGKFTLDELAAAALKNEGYMARALRQSVVDRCKGVANVSVPAVAASGDSGGLPAANVPITDACNVLAKWDGIYDLDRAGPALWREFVSRYGYPALNEAGTLWAQPFDAKRPVDTPSGLAPAPASGTDPVLVNLARAVQVLQKAGFTPSTTLGDEQYADRNGTKVPLHGGREVDGTTNVVTSGADYSTTQDIPATGPPVATDAVITADGYPISDGSSFVLVVAFGSKGPSAKAFLTYSGTDDTSSSIFVDATKRFSEKNWRTVVFTEAQIKNDPNYTEESVSGS